LLCFRREEVQFFQTLLKAFLFLQKQSCWKEKNGNSDSSCIYVGRSSTHTLKLPSLSIHQVWEPLWLSGEAME
jgi:hypothetical protein